MGNNKITPLRDYVVLKENRQNETKSGIILGSNPDTEQTPTAIVESVGPEVKDVEVGQSVLYKVHLFERVILDISDKDKYVLLGQAKDITALC